MNFDGREVDLIFINMQLAWSTVYEYFHTKSNYSEQQTLLLKNGVIRGHSEVC